MSLIQERRISLEKALYMKSLYGSPLAYQPFTVQYLLRPWLGISWSFGLLR